MRKLDLDTKNKIIVLCKTTTKSDRQIGLMFGISRGPVYKIRKENNFKRKEVTIREKINCGYCKKPIHHIISRSRPNRYKYCNKECYTSWQKSDANKKENSPNWKGGSESELQQLRKTPEWREWRTKVFQRDNYTCSNKNCNQVGGILDPHHIIPKSEDISKVYDVNNGITMCHKCHMKLHGRIK